MKTQGLILKPVEQALNRILQLEYFIPLTRILVGRELSTIWFSTNSVMFIDRAIFSSFGYDDAPLRTPPGTPFELLSILLTISLMETYGHAFRVPAVYEACGNMEERVLDILLSGNHSR